MLNIENKRDRKLSNWNIHHDSEGFYFEGFYLTGIVESGVNERPHLFADIPGEKIRLTSTSHLASVQGKIVVTRSGSKYELLEPSSDFVSKYPDYDKENPLCHLL